VSDIRRLIQLVMERVSDEVPELGGRVNDWSVETTAYPNATIDTMYGVETDAECITSDEWVIQMSIWDRNSNSAKHAQLGNKVRLALKGWRDVDEMTMQPLSVQVPVVTRDNDGVTMRARLMIEATIEG